MTTSLQPVSITLQLKALAPRLRLATDLADQVDNYLRLGYHVVLRTTRARRYSFHCVVSHVTKEPLGCQSNIWKERRQLGANVSYTVLSAAASSEAPIIITHYPAFRAKRD